MSSTKYLIFWDFGKCHGIKPGKRTKFLESQLVESLAALSKSEEKQDTKGFLQYNLFVLRFFLHYVKSKFVRVAHITNSIMISYNTMNKLLGKFVYECQWKYIMEFTNIKCIYDWKDIYVQI